MADPQITSLEQQYINELKSLIDAEEKDKAIFRKHKRFLEIAKYALGKNILLQEIKYYCIKEIIQSESGFRFSGFEMYYKILLIISPDLAPTLEHISNFIRKDLKDYLTDGDIFIHSTLPEVGQVLFNKILCSVQGSTPDLIKVVIKDLQSRPPLNLIRTSVTDEDYYEILCFYWDINEPPKAIYAEAKVKFQDIFRDRYPKLISKIDNLIKETETERKRIMISKETIIDNCKRENLLKRDIRETKKEFIKYDFKLKELKALYSNTVMRDGTKACIGMLAYYKKRIPAFFQTFCEDLSNEVEIDKKLRKLTIECIRSHLFNKTAFEELDFAFLPYSRNMKILEFLISGDCYKTLYNLFFKVKFNPFYIKRVEVYTTKEGRDEDEEKFKNDIKNHPMNPSILSALVAQNDYVSYLDTLEKHSGEGIINIRNILEKTLCLRKRKPLIEECISLIENQNNAMAINLLPIQIEGLYFDLLESSTIYNCIDKVELFDSLLGKELVEKIQFGADHGLNLDFETFSYFKYYFNNVIRNTIAHGNYITLIYGRGNAGHVSGISDVVLMRVVVLELLFDLNALVLLISRINEIDTASKYIKGMAEALNPEPGDKIEFVYERFCDDLTGMMSRVNFTEYKAGTMVKFEPLQILSWIFNPSYEEFIDKNSLEIVRSTLTTAPFWDYFMNADIGKFTKYKKERLIGLQDVAQTLFQLDLQKTEKLMLIKVNKTLLTMVK